LIGVRTPRLDGIAAHFAAPQVATGDQGKILSRREHLHAGASDCGTPGTDEIDRKMIALSATLWRCIEPIRAEITVDGLKFLQRTLDQRAQRAKIPG